MRARVRCRATRTRARARARQYGPLAALYAIAKFGDTAVDALIAHAPSAAPDRITRALEQCLSSSKVARRFWELWKRPEPAVRDACLAHLGAGYGRRLETAPRRAALAEHQDDPSIQRRRACVRGWEQLAKAEGADGEAAVHALRAMATDDPDELIRVYARAALLEVGRW